jgi:hypothetical protein
MRRLNMTTKVRVESHPMQLTRREFLGSAAAACLVPPAWAQSEKRGLTPPWIIYYNNFASHLLCAVNSGAVLFPDPEMYRQELVFFARLFADLTAPHPDYDALKQVYWNRVYRIYDRLPNHIDPRPRGNTERFVRHFMGWT